MSNIDTVFMGASDILKRLNRLPDEVEAMIKGKYYDAVNGTYDDSQANVPVLSGDLKDSGAIKLNDMAHKWEYDVSYGSDGATGKVYSYDTNTGPVKADGYAWFVELGTVKMSAQPYLGPAFYTRAETLLQALAEMFS